MTGARQVATLLAEYTVQRRRLVVHVHRHGMGMAAIIEAEGDAFKLEVFLQMW